MVVLSPGELLSNLRGNGQSAEKPSPDRRRHSKPPRAAPQLNGKADRHAVRAQHPGLMVRNIVKSYNRRRVVDNLNFTLRRGETLALLGPRCAGKTTALAMICGLTTADRGQIMLDDTDITGFSMYLRWRLGIGFLSRHTEINRCLSVEQNIALIVKHRVQDRGEGETFLDLLLERFRLSHVRHKSPMRLSAAERQRVEIARILAGEPEFILLDGPFIDADQHAIDNAQSLVRQCADWGLGVLITDRNPAAALDVADRAMVITDGAVLAEGPPQQILAIPEVQSVLNGGRPDS